jgi:type VI secretion system protein ImpK
MNQPQAQPQSQAPPAPIAIRTNSLAYSFQEVLTAILRIRFQRQHVQDSESFRAQIRRSLQSAMQDARALGYSNEIVQTAVYATVAFLDESVLNLQNPVFADWSRRPLQEELFGGHTAGEAFFRNFRDLLGRENQTEVADALELHCLCLMLGYRGRFAFADSGELHQMLRQAREKIARVRGNAQFLAAGPPPEVRQVARTDPWSRGLMLTAAAFALITLIAFGGFEFALGSGASQVQNTSINTR